MARSFPADTRLQHFFEQQYDKERETRLRFYFDTKNGVPPRDRSRSGIVGLPKINPIAFALKKKREEDAEMQQIIEQARQHQSKEEMRKVDDAAKAKLFEGFSKEGRGRSLYLQERHDIIPETKYTFPLLSSWEYGWKVGEETAAYQRPTFARTAKVKDSFYTRNGVPTLKSPTAGPSVKQSFTTLA